MIFVLIQYAGATNYGHGHGTSIGRSSLPQQRIKEQPSVEHSFDPVELHLVGRLIGYSESGDGTRVCRELFFYKSLPVNRQGDEHGSPNPKYKLDKSAMLSNN